MEGETGVWVHEELEECASLVSDGEPRRPARARQPLRRRQLSPSSKLRWLAWLASRPRASALVLSTTSMSPYIRYHTTFPTDSLTIDNGDTKLFAQNNICVGCRLIQRRV